MKTERGKFRHEKPERKFRHDNLRKEIQA